jgi:hypothetical protein
MKKILVIDGQGGKLGSLLVSQLKGEGVAILAVGTNSIATSAMLKAGADIGATGENPVRVNCRDADIIVGPIGIVIADALHGEITPAMAAAVGQARAEKVLLPINRCHTHIAGVQDVPVGDLVELAVKRVNALLSARLSKKT